MREWAREEGLEPYDQATGEGYLRHLVVREGRNTGQALVLLVTAPGERFETGYLVDVLRRFPEVRSVHWAINDTPAERTNLPSKLLWGEEAIEEEILGLRFRVRPERSCRRTPRWPSGCTRSRGSTRASPGTENVSTSTAARARSRSRSPATRRRCGGSRSPRRPSPARSRTPS